MRGPTATRVNCPDCKETGHWITESFSTKEEYYRFWSCGLEVGGAGYAAFTYHYCIPCKRIYTNRDCKYGRQVGLGQLNPFTGKQYDYTPERLLELIQFINQYPFPSPAEELNHRLDLHYFLYMYNYTKGFLLEEGEIKRRGVHSGSGKPFPPIIPMEENVLVINAEKMKPLLQEPKDDEQRFLLADIYRTLRRFEEAKKVLLDITTSSWRIMKMSKACNEKENGRLALREWDDAFGKSEFLFNERAASQNKNNPK